MVFGAVGPSTCMADSDLDSLADGLSGILRSSFDSNVPQKVRIEKHDTSAPWFDVTLRKQKHLFKDLR